MQKRIHSVLESVVNVLVGYGIAVISQIIIFPMFDIEPQLRDNFMIAAWFSLISIIRSYTIRRIFNHGLHGKHG